MMNKLLTILTLIFLVFGMSAVVALDDNDTSSDGGDEDPTAISYDPENVTAQVISPRLTVSGISGSGGSGLSVISTIINSDGSVSLTNTRRVCVINSELMKELEKLMVLLKEAEGGGDKELVNKLHEKIKAIKMETDRELERCRNQQTVTAEAVESRPVYIDICSQIEKYVEKRKHYELLYKLSDAELDDKGYSSEDGKERIRRTINEINEEINRIRIRCKSINSNEGGSESGSLGGGSGGSVVTEDSVEARPIVISSGNEISSYYKVEISKIMSKELESEDRVSDLKELRNDVDELIEELIRSKDELNAEDMDELVDEFKIRPGKIEADDVMVNSVNKKLFVMIKNKNLTIAPEKLKVMIHDGDIKIKSSGLEIRNNSIMMNNSELKLLASDVALKLKLKTKEMELIKENNRLVYKIKTMENRRLFGLIPVDVENDLTVDAESEEVNILNEKLPWWGFLTVK